MTFVASVRGMTVCVSICMCISHTPAPCWSHWIEWDAVWQGHSCGPISKLHCDSFWNSCEVVVVTVCLCAVIDHCYTLPRPVPQAQRQSPKYSTSRSHCYASIYENTVYSCLSWFLECIQLCNIVCPEGSKHAWLYSMWNWLSVFLFRFTLSYSAIFDWLSILRSSLTAQHSQHTVLNWILNRTDIILCCIVVYM